MPTKPWFPTLIYQSPLQGQASAAVAGALLADCRAVRDGDTDGLLWCQTNYPSGYTSYETLGSSIEPRRRSSGWSERSGAT